ncbi:MAG: sugar phosphate isomerase/epimerase family protein [Anaerolineae bacterium]
MKLALAVQTPEVPRMVPVALLSGTFEEKLAKAAGWGANGVELMPSDPATLDVAGIRAALAQNGLEVAAIGTGAVGMSTGLTLLHADAEQAKQAEGRLRDLIDLAAALGAPIVTVGSFRGKLAFVGEEGRARLVSVLHAGAAYAAEKGVKIALEPLNHYETDLLTTSDEVLAFLDEVEHPALGMLIDTYHASYEEPSWMHAFRRPLKEGRLLHVHLGDSNRLAPGGGMTDFKGIVTILGGLGYTRYLSAELLAKPDPDTAGRRTLHIMGALLEEWR